MKERRNERGRMIMVVISINGNFLCLIDVEILTYIIVDGLNAGIDYGIL